MFTYFSSNCSSIWCGSVINTTATSITVQWGMVPCIHQNGDITGYSVRYGVKTNGNTQTMIVSGASATDVTIQNLTASTTYMVHVAAVNDVGTGVYSN